MHADRDPAAERSKLGRMASALRRLWITPVADAPSTEAAHAASVRYFAPHSQKRLDATDAGAFMAGIEAFRAANETGAAVTAGSIQLLDFDHVRKRCGNRWTAVHERVCQIVETCLDARLGEHDLYVAIDDQHYMVLFGRTETAEAVLKARLIAADITQRLCGSVPDGASISVETLTMPLEGGLAGVTSVADLIERMRLSEQRATTRGREAFEAEVDDLRPVFWPMVNLRKWLVSGYRIASHPPVTDDDMNSGNGEFAAARDMWLLRQAATVVPRLGGKGRKAMLLVPLGYGSLAFMRHREPYLAACRHLADSAVRRLVFELTDVPRELPQARLRELMAYIKPFALGVVCRLDGPTTDIDHLDASGVSGVSLDLAGLGGIEEAAGCLRQIVDLASPAHLPVFAVNAASVPLAQLAARAGVEYLEGEGFMPAADMPGRVFAVARVDIAAGRPVQPVAAASSASP